MERRRQYNIETNLSLGGFNYYFLINVMSKEEGKEMKREARRSGDEKRDVSMKARKSRW